MSSDCYISYCIDKLGAGVYIMVGNWEFGELILTMVELNRVQNCSLNHGWADLFVMQSNKGPFGEALIDHRAL